MELINNIENFRKRLVDVINTSNVSLGVGYYVVKDVYNDLKILYIQTLNDEANTLEEEEESIEIIPPENNLSKEEWKELESNEAE